MNKFLKKAFPVEQLFIYHSLFLVVEKRKRKNNIPLKRKTNIDIDLKNYQLSNTIQLINRKKLQEQEKHALIAALDFSWLNIGIDIIVEDAI